MAYKEEADNGKFLPGCCQNDWSSLHPHTPIERRDNFKYAPRLS